MKPSTRAATETDSQTPAPASDDDFENCKGRCGYTIWCRACMEERKRLIEERERKEMDHVEGKYP